MKLAVRPITIKAAAALGIAVHDHLIIGRGGHTSLCQLGIIPSKAEYTGANLDAPVFARHSALHDDNCKD